MTPLPIPLIRGRAFSSAENGQRLLEAAFFSLEMFTTHAWVFSTASTITVRRVAPAEPALTTPGAASHRTAITLRANVPRNPSLHRNKGIGTARVPTA